MGVVTRPQLVASICALATLALRAAASMAAPCTARRPVRILLTLRRDFIAIALLLNFVMSTAGVLGQQRFAQARRARRRAHNTLIPKPDAASRASVPGSGTVASWIVFENAEAGATGSPFASSRLKVPMPTLPNG